MISLLSFQESPKPVQRTSGFTPFKGVDRKEIKFTVTYKDQIYTKSFMESKTLQVRLRKVYSPKSNFKSLFSLL